MYSLLSLLQQMEKPGLSMAPLSSVEQTQTPAKRWVLQSQGVARGRAQLACGSSMESYWGGPHVCCAC